VTGWPPPGKGWTGPRAEKGFRVGEGTEFDRGRDKKGSVDQKREKKRGRGGGDYLVKGKEGLPTSERDLDAGDPGAEGSLLFRENGGV